MNLAFTKRTVHFNFYLEKEKRELKFVIGQRIKYIDHSFVDSFIQQENQYSIVAKNL